MAHRNRKRGGTTAVEDPPAAGTLMDPDAKRPVTSSEKRVGWVTVGKMIFRRLILVSAMCGFFAGIMASADAQTTGPSSSERPYLLGAAADGAINLLDFSHFAWVC